MGVIIFWVGGVAFVAAIGTAIIVTCEYIGNFL